MFQLRHLHVALALACGLFLAACGGGDSGGSEFVEQFDGFTPDVGPDALIITTTSIPAGTPGVTYPVTSLSVQGSAPVTWQVTEGALPQGLALTSDGRLMGTPAEEGVYEFTARASDGTSVAEQDLLLAVGTIGLRAINGLQFGEAWSGRPVALRAAGHSDSVVFETLANRSGGSFTNIDPVGGTAFWHPGATPGIDILSVRDTATGETADLELVVVNDPTDTHMARFGGHDVWFLDWNAKTGAHPYATDLRAAMTHVGLRSVHGYGANETEADRLAELVVKVEILREINPMFLRNRDGTEGEAGLPISFAFERPGAGFVSPVAGSTIGGRGNGYSVMSLCDRVGRFGAIGVAFADTMGNANHEHNGSGGAGELGVFVNVIAQTIEHSYAQYGNMLRGAPIDAEDMDALRAILHGRPGSGDRYDLIRYQVTALARSIACVAAHEVGHSLGLGHNSTFVYGGIMNSGATLAPGVDYHFSDGNLAILRAGLPGPGRMSSLALKVTGGGAVMASLVAEGVHVCGGCPSGQ